MACSVCHQRYWCAYCEVHYCACVAGNHTH